MQYVYHLLTLVVWTLLCAAFVYGVERVLEGFGYKAEPLFEGPDNRIPPVPPE